MESVPANYVDRTMLVLHRLDEPNWYIGAGICYAGALPSHEHFRRFVLAAIDAAPVLRYRRIGPIRKAKWVPDDAIDVDQHIEYHRLPPGGDPYNAAMRAIRYTSLPMDRPLWKVHLLHGYKTGEYTLCYQASHAFQDGMSAMATLRAVMTGVPLRPPPVTRYPGRSTLCGVLRTLPELRPYPSDPRWRPPADTTGAVLFRVVHLDLDTVQEIATRTDCGPAQVTLAAVTGAMHHWNPRRKGGPHRRPRTFNVFMPTSFGDGRRNGGLGTHSGIMPLVLPGDEPSPYRRLLAIREAVSLKNVISLRRNQAFVDGLGFPPARIVESVMRLTDPMASIMTRGHIAFTMLPANSFEIPDAIDLFIVPPLPWRIGAYFNAVHSSTGITIGCGMNGDLPDVDQVPDLIQDALTELHDATVQLARR
ncbi:wax ester/triacylglycerol synthase domain-containing protein [Actinomadura sp. 1N219]|uniref:wax ester/triacylglycerol synthase domain-containing protein n=1 Tax=Actinomadura sp. 1N219 TaxID=3375152 RepID=UPI00379F19BB